MVHFFKSCPDRRSFSKAWVVTMRSNGRCTQYIVSKSSPTQSHILRQLQARQKVVRPRPVARPSPLHNTSPYESLQQLFKHMPLVELGQSPNAHLEGIWRRFVIRLIQDKHMRQAEEEHNRLHLYVTSGEPANECNRNCTFARFRKTGVLNPDCVHYQKGWRGRTWVFNNGDDFEGRTWVTVKAEPWEIEKLQTRLAYAEAMRIRLRESCSTSFSLTFDEKCALLGSLVFILNDFDIVIQGEGSWGKELSITDVIQMRFLNTSIDNGKTELAQVWLCHLKDRYSLADINGEELECFTSTVERYERAIYNLRCREAAHELVPGGWDAEDE